MNPLGEVRRGIYLGRTARKLFTELRKNSVAPWDAVNPDSPYYDRTRQFKEKYPFLEHLGIIIGQLMHPGEWYLNAEYLFGD